MRYRIICCSQVAPTLLLHVSLLLALFTGAGLATVARLRWDPTTYLIVRKLLPTEYYVVNGVLCFGTFTLLVLGHVAFVAISIGSKRNSSLRRPMLFTYAVMMTLLMFVELVTFSWFCVRIVKWLNTGNVGAVQEIYNDFGPYVKKGLKMLSWFSQYFQDVHDRMKEVEDDVPCNFHIGIACVVIIGILQPISIVLAINAAYTFSATSRYCTTTKVIRNIRYNNELNPERPSQICYNEKLQNDVSKY